MRHHVAAYGILLVLFLLSLSCAKLNETPARAPGGPAVERVASSDSIPQEWGALVAVAGEYPTHRLWFQNEAGDLHVVGFNNETARFDSLAFVIHRKGGVDR